MKQPCVRRRRVAEGSAHRLLAGSCASCHRHWHCCWLLQLSVGRQPHGAFCPRLAETSGHCEWCQLPGLQACQVGAMPVARSAVPVQTSRQRARAEHVPQHEYAVLAATGLPGSDHLVTFASCWYQ